MSISKKLKELIVAFGAAQNVNALKGNRIDSLIGTLAAWISEHGGGGSLPTPGAAGNVMTSTGDGWESAPPHGGDTYETVAEIEVGTMEQQGGMYFADNVALDLSGVSADDALYFNSEEYPLTRMENEGILIYGYNFSGGGISGTPAYGIVINPTDGNSIVSDTSAIENTTVKILKKVGVITVDNELSETSVYPVQNKVITAALADKMDANEIPEANASANGKTLGVENGVYALVSPSALNDYVVTLTIDPDAQTITTDNKTVAEINAAIEAGKNVYAELEEEINGATVMQRFYPTMYCATMVVFGGNLVAASGSGVELDPVCIVGTHAGNMDTWIAVGK